MIGERIRELRKKANMSQAELARKLNVTRTSVNAWESGLSAPTAVFLIELSKLFHVSADYILELDSEHSLSLNGLTEQEISLIYQLFSYFDYKKDISAN